MAHLVLYEGEKGQVADYELASQLKSLNVCEAGLGPAGKAVLSNFRKVGLVSFRGHEVEIRPKVEMAQILSLLDPELNSFNSHDGTVGLAETEQWTDVLALFFETQLFKALVRGPLEGYVTVSEWTKTLRGKVEFAALATSGRFGSPELFVTHDEFTRNVPENQILKTAIEVLLSTRGLAIQRRKSLRYLSEVLSGVDLLEVSNQYPDFVGNRAFAAYGPALRTAGLILRGQSIEARGGRFESNSFLIDMAQLFEAVIERQFTEFSKGSSVAFSAQYRESHLDKQGLFRIAPDYMFSRDGVPIGLADAKYKVAESSKQIRNADINQMIAYCSRFNLSAGHLIYAKSPEFSVDIEGGDLALTVHELDLSNSKSEIMSKLEKIWTSIVG